MKHKPSVSKEHPSQNPPVQFDVPADGSCLFWSTALAYLIPVKDDDIGFQQKYTTLFGDEGSNNGENLKQLIDNCFACNRIASNEKVKDLVDQFRNKVADYISSDAELRGAVDKDNILCLFDNQNRQEEIICETFERNLGLCYNGEDIKNRKAIIQKLLNNKEKNEANNLVFRVYLECVRNNQFWGGEPEIEAISKMLEIGIDLYKDESFLKTVGENSNTKIRLHHVNDGTHYQFSLPRNIVDAYRGNVENIPGQRSSIKPELIELLLTEPINPKSSRGSPVFPINREKPVGFAEKFSLFLDETPCIGSTSKKEFFIHGVLGSVLTLPSSGLIQKLGIKNVYVKHDMKVKSVKDQKVVSSDIIKLCFVFEKDGKKQIALRVFVNDETKCKNQEDEYRYSDGELKEIAGKLGISDINSVDVNEHVFFICTEKDKNNSSQFRLYERQIDRVKERFKTAVSSPDRTDKFKEVSADNALDLGDSFKKLSYKNVKAVIGGTGKIFEKLANVYQDNQKKLSLSESEAAYHGFFYGALALNFKYRYGLNCYAERAAGNGRADLTLISRTKDANNRVNPEPIPVIVEFKAGNHTASEAIKQIKDDGYLYNLSVRSKAENAVIVGVNPAKSDALQVKPDVIFQSQGFIDQVLKQRKRFKPNRVNEINKINEIKDILKNELKNLYHSIPSHDQHYLSKVIFGQVLAAKDDNLNKYIFIYGGKDESIGKKTTTFVLSDSNQAVILNIIEHSQKEPEVDLCGRTKNSKKQASVFKILPIHKLRIGSAVKTVKIDVEINTENKPDGFEVKGKKNKSYYQDINIEEVSQDIDIEEVSQDTNIEEVSDTGREGEYYGEFKWIGNVDVGGLIRELKGKHTKTEPENQLSHLRQNLFDRKELISKERDFQAILQGVFMNGEDENCREIRVYAETNASPKGRMDLALSFTHLKYDDSFEEGCPIIMELKNAAGIRGANTALEEAKKQLKEKYSLIKSFTSKGTAKLLAMVFNQAAKKESKLISFSTENLKVEHTTSPSETDSQTVVDSPEKKIKSSPLDFGRFPLSEGSLKLFIDTFGEEVRGVLYEIAKNPDEFIAANTKFKFERTTLQSETDSQTVVDSPEKKTKSSLLGFGIFQLSEGSLNSEYTASSSDKKQRSDKFDFQAGSPPSKRRKRTRSTKSHNEKTKLKYPDLSNEDDNLVKIDVPGDGSCLFWSVALAYLIPSSENEFDERCKLLFGEENSEGFEELRELISSSDFLENLCARKSVSRGENILRNFINKFRGKVADYISSDQNLKGSVNIHNICHLFENQTAQEKIICEKLKGSDKLRFEGKNLKEISDRFCKAKENGSISEVEENEVNDAISEVYVECVRDDQFWGSELEIKAITRMLSADISTTQGCIRISYSDRKYNTTIELFHVNNNHYQFGLKRDIFQSIAQTLEGRTDLSPNKQSGTSNSSTGKENILPHRRPKITEKHSSSLSQNCLDNVSVQVHSTQARDLGEK